MKRKKGTGIEEEIIRKQLEDNDCIGENIMDIKWDVRDVENG